MKLFVSLSLLVSSVSGQCTICPNGAEFPDVDPLDGSDFTCATIGPLYADLDAASCRINKLVLMPTCCPDQFVEMAKDNACEWCPNGIADGTTEFQVPFGTDTTTCLEYLSVVALGADASTCFVFAPAAQSCCPDDAGDIFSCDFCSNGVEFPDVDPFTSGQTCQDYADTTDFIPDEGSCDAIKFAEPACCPGSVDDQQFFCTACSGGVEFPDLVPFEDGVTCAEYPAGAIFLLDELSCTIYRGIESQCCPSSAVDSNACDYCADGIENPDARPFGDDTTCAEIAMSIPFIFDDASCNNLKFTQASCCPAFVGATSPPVTEGDYCYICGDADTNMANPDGKPYGLGADENEEMTCMEMEADLNANRVDGTSCAIALGFVNNGPIFIPSFCGCEGAEPVNAPECLICDDILRDVVAPNETFTCGEGVDYLSHARKELCENASFNFTAIAASCCAGGVANGGGGTGGGGGGDDEDSGATVPSVLFAILMIAAAAVSAHGYFLV